MDAERWTSNGGRRVTSPGARTLGTVIRRVPLVLVLGAAAALSLTGCGAHDSTGQISVTVSSNAADRPYEVEVFASTGKLSEHQRVFPGGTADFAGVPLGDVTVRAGDLCPAKATVSDDDVTRVTLSTTGC
ncbi:hypothetical protein C1N91_02660 [Curtobacterium sp. SGAir0471]|nr:hypothetical protein C1N91_02660 [Curtobacterium sp. SGAir0471]